MFKYAEKTEEKKLVDLNNEFKTQKEEESIYRKRLDYINAYNKMINDTNDAKSNVIFFDVFLGLAIIVCFLTPIALLPVGIALLGSAINTRTLISQKQKLKKEYGDICTLSKEQIDCEKNLLYKILRDYSVSMKNIKSNAANATSRLLEVESVRKIMNNPYYQADTEQEYNFLKQIQKEKSKHLNDYLEKQVDYADIHFDNCIGENIEYTENSKKLLKKM